MSGRMRLLGLAVVLAVLLSSCLAANGRALNTETYSYDVHHRSSGRVLAEEDDQNVKPEAPAIDLTNHHGIPRSQFHAGGSG
ncbi:hypothetical protein WN943_008179 [Citrus x changshan-huyou]